MRFPRRAAVAVLAAVLPACLALAGPPPMAPEKKPDYPPFDKVSEGLDKVVSTADGKPGLYTLFANRKDGRLLAELPKNHEQQLVLIATTVAAGDEDAGVMGGSVYAKWKKIGKRMALIEPNFVARSSGDAQSKDSVKQLFTDRVILDVPIVTTGPGGGPVIDLKGLMVGQHTQFFGPMSGGYGPMVMKARTHLATLDAVKAFPENVEVTYKMPRADGRFVSLHYSVRELKKDPTFKPRVGDTRVGYFNVFYRELGEPGRDEPYTRYIARWNLEKADPGLKMSPPKEPIVWYIEHSTPVRYRRWVRDGIETWNEAFEEIGIINAVEVYQQDAVTGAHMEKDPEDARYNFFRWNTSTRGYAIGPSRWDPRTGQIVDADVVWHAGLTDAVMSMYKGLTGEIAVQGLHPETLAWLETRPQWDPRVRFAPPAVRERLIAGGHDTGETHDHALDAFAEQWLGHRPAPAIGEQGHGFGQSGSSCRIGEHMAMNVGLFTALFDANMLGVGEDDDDDEGEDDDDGEDEDDDGEEGDDDDDEGEDDDDDDVARLDDLPEEFLGAMIRYISAHEVGHTMGLQHNFAASTIRTLEQINSPEMDGEPFIASVMEYAGVNLNADDGEIQGQYATPRVGPYDKWAIAFGYGPADQRQAVLAKVSEPDHVFLNDLATIGPDPRAQVWDMGADSLNFSESRMRLVRDLRGKIVDELVEDGQPWQRARDRYGVLLSNQMMTLVVASRWVGGAYVHWDHKGDPGNRPPIENVDPEQQRRALDFIIENAFQDDAFGLTPELVTRLGIQYWPDGPGYERIFDDANYEVHDTVAAVQASAMTMIMNPTKLRRVYDNEYRTAGDENAVTLAEVMGRVTDAVWTELDEADGSYTAASPLVSSFRRNLQREHLERLVDLAMPAGAASPSMRTIANLSTLKLRQISAKIDKLGERDGLDEYTVAHLADARTRIDKALEAVYVIR